VPKLAPHAGDCCDKFSRAARNLHCEGAFLPLETRREDAEISLHSFNASIIRRKEATMRVSEAMTPNVQIANPSQTIREAAKMMADIDAGALPVGDNDRLVGVITDRDIAIRAVAQGLEPDTKISDVMSREVMYCFEDEDIEDVAHNMADIKVRRLPVLNRKKRLVGIVSLGDIAMADGPEAAGEAICGVSEPGGLHSQTANGRG
jgi:CBS domain-containing protein